MLKKQILNIYITYNVLPYSFPRRGWPDLMEDWTFDDGLQFDEPQTDSREVPMPKDYSFDMPLYENAPTSVAECLLLIMTYINCHKVTGKALGDLLKLITLLCPKNLNTDCLGSIHKFKDFFSHSVPSPVVMHKYCSNCLSTVHNDDTICQLCEVSLLEEGATSHFIEVSIEAQLQTLFAKKGFQEKLKFRFMRQKKGKDNVEDIYDGQVYKQYASGDGLLCNPHNISFTWNTDGVPIFKSSKFSVWPFYCVINELSFVERTKRENMIFAGLWFGDSKPSMLTFLKPLCEKLHELEEHGVLVKHPETPEYFLCKVLTIAGTCDLPAKAMVLNTVQFNGKYGCMKCEQPGTTEKTGARGHMHAFPFQHSDPKGPPRTHDKLVNDAKSALATKGHVHGVKGPTWLTKVNSFDVILGTGVDYMHSVLLGVMRTLMFLWFSMEFSREPFSMAKESKEIDKRLSEIHPPSTVTRHPRSVSSHRMYFKASEYRSLLLFFGPVVFYGILGAIYYNHFLLLSEAIYILLMESITKEQIDHAEKLLWNFCSQMGPLYGKRYETANVHLLVHLADSVRALGPLWTHSCFHFEDKNGYLLRLIHGTQNIPMQMINAVKLVQSLPSVAQTVKPKLAIADFYARMSNDYTFCSESNKISKEMLIGAWTHHQLEGNHLSALQKYAGHPIQNNLVRAFNRAQVGKVQLTSRNYNKGIRRNNFTVMFWNGEEKKYGQVEFFLTSEELGHNSKLAIVTEFESAGFHLLRDHVTNGTCFHIAVLLEVPVNVTVVPVDHILGKVVYLDLSSMPGIVFAAHFPNTLEKD